MPVSKLQQEALDYIAAHDSAYVIGIDEVGLGAWAGPVTVAAAVVPKGWSHPLVKDSKQISHSKRVRAIEEVIESAAVCKVVLSQTNAYIDDVGVDKAVAHLTEGCATYCRVRYPNALVVLDGFKSITVFESSEHIVCLPKADELVPAVSAASILAKVSRDTYMKAAQKQYHGYGFETNVGYHSAKHVRGLERQGPCPLHRRSYRSVKRYDGRASTVLRS